MNDSSLSSEPMLPTKVVRQPAIEDRAQRAPLREWLKAVDSGWRAGIKQFRRMRTMQRNARNLPDPFLEQA